MNDAERLVSLADGLGCGGLLVGQPVAGFIDVDCAAQPVSVAADGITVLERTGGNLAQRLLPLLEQLWQAHQRRLRRTTGPLDLARSLVLIWLCLWHE